MRQFAAQFRAFYFYAGLFSLLINLLMLTPALFMLLVYDRVVTSRSVETLLMLVLLVAGALVCMAYLDAVRGRLLASAGVTLERRLGPIVLSDMLRRAGRHGPGDTLHGLKDVGALRAFLTGPGIIALFDAPWVPIYVVVIFLFHPYLGVIALGGGLLLLVLAVINEALARKPLQDLQVEQRRAGRFAEQALANAEVVGALGMVEAVARGWGQLSRRGFKLLLKANRGTSVLTALVRFSRQFLQVAMLAVGAWLVIEQHSSTGVMIAATILLARALAPVESAVAGWKGLVDARSAYARLDRVLAAGPTDQAVTALPAPKGFLAIERVIFGFRGQERPVIRQVSFSVPPGGILAIVGPSAAGKSTLARLIVGLWRPMSGVVRLDGADIARWPREQLGPHIGYLPQDVELFAGTVSENISRMGEMDSTAVVEAAQRANAHEMILRLAQGYDTPVGDGGAFLSAGQRQRIALARALYGKPRLVVLDEPNSNLDTEGEAALIAAVRRLREERVTVVAVTHRPSLLAAADRVLLLREGVVEKFGTLAQVLPPFLSHTEGAGKQPTRRIGGKG